MLRQRSALVLALAVCTFACGGATTDPNTNNQATGNGRTMTATFNGTAFKPTTMTSAYLGGQTAVNAADGTHNLLINANAITATGKYSVSAGNANSAIAQWIDNTGAYSSLGAGGGGTVTFTVLQLGRVAGSFDFIAKNTNSTATMTVTGTFDVKFP